MIHLLTFSMSLGRKVKVTILCDVILSGTEKRTCPARKGTVNTDEVWISWNIYLPFLRTNVTAPYSRSVSL